MKLGDVVNLKRGYDLPRSKRCNGTIPIVSSSGITDYHNVAKEKAPGVITGRYGTIGDVFYVNQDYWPLNTTLYVEDFKGNDPLFISYFLKTIDFDSFAAKSAVPGINRNDLHMADVSVPGIKTQKKIAAILSTYDDLIQVNKNRITNLEKLAQKLYIEWFVDFHFPGYENVKMNESNVGMLPVGWRVGSLDEISFNYKKAIKKENRNDYENYLPIDCLPKKSFLLNEVRSVNEAESSLIEFSKNDILMGAMRVYFHKVICAPFSGITRSTCFVIKPKRAEYHGYLYMTLFQDRTIDYANTISVGATMPYVNWDTFSKMKIIIPSDEYVIKYNDIIQPIISYMSYIYFENVNLKKIYEMLLPRLVSGDIDVSTLDIKIKEVSM